jgi:hypothetical protein
MAKIFRGRIAGLNGMKSWTVEELHAWADQFEQRAHRIELNGIEANDEDDALWLRRWVERLRCLAEQKELAREHKTNLRRA